MDIRASLCLVLCALAVTSIGCNQVGKSSADAGSTPYKIQRITLSSQVADSGQDPLTIYNEDLTLLSRRVESSASDRWYLTSHRDGLNKQIKHDMETIQSDIADMSQMENAPVASHTIVRGVVGRLKPDASRVTASVQAYMDQTTQAGHDQALATLRKDLQDSLKRLASIRKVKQTVVTTTAKL